MGKGFYLIGSLWKGQKAKWGVTTSRPFTINIIEGTIIGNVLVSHPNNFSVSHWFYFQYHKISDIDTNDVLANQINSIWKNWCKETKKKYSPILDLSIKIPKK